MQKSLFIFIVLLVIPYAHGLNLELNQRSYSPNDKLVIFGTATPNDSLIIELFNPTGNIIYRSQIDVNSKGEFASIILTWPTPDDNRFRVGVYTLVLTSSINNENKVSKAFVYQLQKEKEDNTNTIISKIDLDLAIPSTARLNQTIPIIARVTLNDAPLIRLESISGMVRYPDGKEMMLNNFTEIGDGLYQTSFTSNIEGYSIIILNVKHEGIMSNKAFIINVENNLDLNKEFDAIKRDMNIKFDTLDKKISNDTLSISNNVSSIKQSIENMTSSTSQLTSLLLPILGMIAIIVALQATILAKDK